jgi:hypothetical protein
MLAAKPAPTVRLRAARHEAGHLLAAYWNGRNITGAEISEGGGHADVQLLREGATEVSLEDVVNDCAILIAGCDVERRTFPGAGDDGDVGRAVRLAEAHTDSEHEAQAVISFASEKLRTLFDHPAAAAAIERLSDALLARGKLSGNEITTIIGGTNGKP